MTSAGRPGLRRRDAVRCLAGVLALAGLLAALLINGGLVAHADGPTITLSTSTTNPGGEVIITGTGWAPAKHYTLYVYSQRACNGQPTCPPPAGAKPVNSTPFAIRSDGTWSFDFTFSKGAGTITYVFTAIADYPTDNPFTASVPIQVLPAGTPPSGTPISSSPTATPTPTIAPATPTATASQNGGGTGSQTNTATPSSGGSNKLPIVALGGLLLIGVIVLVALLIILPPKRRAIRAQYYGSDSPGSRGYTTPGARRNTGAHPPLSQQGEPPWQGGVAQWDDEPPRPPRSRPTGPSGSRPYPPRRPSDRY
jgi:hypothetical protein